VNLPEGVVPGKVPTRELLDALTEDDLFAVIKWQQDQNYVYVGTQFWIDELSRRRTEGVLDRIAVASAEESKHAAEIVRLTAAAAAENAKTATLNQEMRNMTRTMMFLTVASVLLAGAALVVSVIALAQGG
jgi:hypothetical protein